MTLDNMSFSPLVYHVEESEKVLDQDLTIDLELHTSSGPYRGCMRIKRGFRTDGASVPFIFRWDIPNWSDSNQMLNVAAIMHDALYAERGFGLLNRDECDDMYRGALREAGIPRWKAAFVDMAVFTFGGGGEHWGDNADNRGKVAFSMCAV